MGARVLVVDDEPSSLQLLEYVLSKADYEVTVARDGAAGLTMVEKVLPHLIVADVAMAGLDGLDMCRRIRQIPGFELVPFLFLSARGQLDEQIEGLRTGADDYLSKPFDRGELLARIDAALRRAQAYQEAARTDALTELGNREHFEQRLREELYREKRYGIFSSLALVAIDIDEIEAVIADYGSAAGDLLVRHVGRFLRGSVRALDVPTRYSPSGFIILMPHTSRDRAMVAVRRLSQRLNATRVAIDDVSLPVRASFGVAIVDREMADLTEMLNRAHASMIMARRQEGSSIWVWSDEEGGMVEDDDAEGSDR